MTEPKGPSEIPENQLPGMDLGADDAVETSSERDAILEDLLKSNSSDDGQSPATKNTKKTSKKPMKTGTSLDKKSKKSKFPLIASIVAGALVLGGGGTALVIATNAPEASQIDENENDGKTKAIENDNNEESDFEEEADAPWNKEDGVYPIELDEWQKDSGKEGISKASEKELLEDLLGSDLNLSAGTLPSEAAGFTSDDSKIFDEAGDVNPLYSYWTQESFTSEAGQIIEKFINPRFGEWEDYQGKGSDPNSIKPASLFPNTFTDELLASSDPISGWLPIYADWENNNYGRNDLSATGPRWYGVMESSTSDFAWDEDTSQYIVNFTGNVEFTTYKSNGEKLSENGVLALELVANPGGERGPGGKILVNKSTLTIGG